MDDVEDEELEPLECVALPVSVEAYDVELGGFSTVRVFFRMSGGQSPEPGGALSEVVVLEQWDRVAIGLVRRVLSGDAPDGTALGGEPLIEGPQVSLDVVLREPLRARPLIDASTGNAIPRIARTSTDVLPAEALGTPRWVSS
jgi:hypothetical protein